MAAITPDREFSARLAARFLCEPPVQSSLEAAIVEFVLGERVLVIARGARELVRVSQRRDADAVGGGAGCLEQVDEQAPQPTPARAFLEHGHPPGRAEVPEERRRFGREAGPPSSVTSR